MLIFRDYHWKSDGDIVDFMARIIGKIWVSWDNLGSDKSRFLNGVKSKSPPNPKNWWNRDCYLSSYLGWLVGNTNLVCHFIFLLCVVWENKKIKCDSILLQAREDYLMPRKVMLLRIWFNKLFPLSQWQLYWETFKDKVPLLVWSNRNELAF